MADPRAHWQQVYAEKDPRRVSWYEHVAERSLALIEEANLQSDAAIVDVGGGLSRLAADLLSAGFTDVTVADVSRLALDRAQAAMGGAAQRVHWVEADVRRHDFGRRFDLWHDRAVFHFMVAGADRNGYLEVLRRTLRPRGHLVVAVFGPDGPTSCSGLPVARYDLADLQRALGDDFVPVASALHTHRTPSGGRQQFLYAHLSYGRPPAPAG